MGNRRNVNKILSGKSERKRAFWKVKYVDGGRVILRKQDING
jgi:hypothetical protein